MLMPDGSETITATTNKWILSLHALRFMADRRAGGIPPATGQIYQTTSQGAEP